MRKMTMVLAVLVASAFPAVAADVTTKEVMLKSGKGEIKGFLAVPEGKGPFPAVVVIQEWWGLTDWLKDQAKRLAKEGYVALAPDLYHGKVATVPAEAQKLMNGMPADRALRDLKSATDYLAGLDSVNKDKLGVIGWCMGGGYALQASLADKRISACVMCYGRVITKADDLEPLHASVLGIFGTKDTGILIADVRKFAAALKDKKKKVEIKEYEAGHGFMRDASNNKAYDEKSAKAAWQEIDKYFANTLKGK